jgi:FixJ family two-component response regulator
MKSGAVEFLTKPFKADTLLGAFQRAIERSRATLGHGSRDSGRAADNMHRPSSKESPS